MLTKFTGAKFPLGSILSTPGAIETFGSEVLFKCLVRHSEGDWGDLDLEDIEENELSLREGFRLLSSYTIEGKKLWVITERDRSVTVSGVITWAKSVGWEEQSEARRQRRLGYRSWQSRRVSLHSTRPTALNQEDFDGEFEPPNRR